MLRRIYTASLTFAILVGISTFAWAQGRGGTGGMSAFGSSGMGGMGMGSSAFGSSGMGGMGMSSMGRSGMGGSGFGSMGMGGMGLSGMGLGGSAFGSSAMGRSGMGGGMYGGQGGGQAFVGRDSGDMAAVFNQMGRASTQFFNQMNRNSRGGNRNNRNQQNANTPETAASNVRVRLELAFNPARPTPTAVANTVRTRLASILPDQGVAQPDVSLDGNVVVLRGVAASDTQRQVLERLIAMEPGVMSVRNEMTVAGSDDQN
jgi:hypothetical protein